MLKYRALILAAALTACSSMPSPSSWTPAQTAYVELAIATAAVQIAESTIPALPAADQTDVHAGIGAFEAGIQAQISVLTAGASVSSQAQSAAVAAVTSAVSQLGAILVAKPAAATNPQAVAMAAGTEALQTIPAVAGAVIAVNGGLQPSAATIQASLAAFAAAGQ